MCYYKVLRLQGIPAPPECNSVNMLYEISMNFKLQTSKFLFELAVCVFKYARR